MSTELFLMYLSVVFVATIVPGPSMLLALKHGVSYGFQRTLSTGAGYLLANLIMAWISYAGLGVILIASGKVFLIIKWTGAAYLVYLGIRTFFEPSGGSVSDSKEGPGLAGENKKLVRMFLDGFIVAAGNPKGIIFFSALFPQFISGNTNASSLFGMIFIPLAIIALGCFMLYAAFGNRLAGWFRNSSVKKIFNKVTGGLFVGLGLAVLFSKI